MLLVDHQLKKFLPDIVTPYEPELISPNSLDLRLSNSFQILDKNKTERTIDPKRGRDLLPWRSVRANEIEIQPNEFLLASTLEEFKIPNNIYAIVAGKSTVAREGILVECAGLVDSSFTGSITLEIKNLTPYTYRLHANQLIAQIMFHTCGEVETSYDKVGTYNGQKAATKGNTSKLYRFVK